MKYLRYGSLLLMVIIQSCSPSVDATLIQKQPSPIPPTTTAEIAEPIITPIVEPTAGFKAYRDTVFGVSIFIPESWVETQIFPGTSASLQSYPEDKYIGGEPFQAGDTKCDLRILPPETELAELVEQQKSGVNVSSFIEQDIVLNSGKPGKKLEIESMGRSNSMIAEIHSSVVMLTCFGDLEIFDEIALTLRENE